MLPDRFTKRIFILPLAAPLFLVPYETAHGQSTATLLGRVVDPVGAVVPGARIVARNWETGVERTAQSDSQGNYQVAALPVGVYRVEVRVPGFQRQVVESLSIEVARTVVQDFQLRVGDIAQEIKVTSEA